MIETLPDDVLLKIFKFFVNAIYSYYSPSEEWRTLVHVCRKWRNLAFTFPRHLNLQLHSRPSKRSVKEMLDTWPELPTYIRAFDYKAKETIDNVVAALRLNHRVSGIRFEALSDSAWETFAPLVQQPFPTLTYLWIEPYFPTNVISRSFLGGSAPSLRVLHLGCISFPTLPELLPSATGLVRLWYDDIPPSGYIPPQAMVAGLSALTRLESLSLTFRHDSLRVPDRTIRIPPLPTRILLPALTHLCFQGVPEYMEDLVAQIDAPLLESMVMELSYQEVPDVSELAKFVRRADKLSLIDRAEVIFESRSIYIKLSQELLEGIVNPKTLRLYPACLESDLRFSYLAQFCASCLPNLTLFESLQIRVPFYHRWEDIIVDPGPQWLELLRPFNPVKKLYLSKYVAPHVTQTLRGLSAERVMEVLPALEKVFVSNLETLGPVREAISAFVDARQLSGHPVLIGDWEGGYYI